MTIIQQKIDESPESQETNSRHDHFAQFYQTDAFLLDTLNTYITTGLKSGDICIVVATQSHREGLEARLQANGVDISSFSGSYRFLDAEEMLAQFMVEGEPDPTLF